MTEFDVWSEGFVATGNIGTAMHIGRVSGATFRDAVLAHYAAHPDKFFDPAALTLWGCRLFDNEAEAREAFG